MPWRGSRPEIGGRADASPVSRPPWNGAFAARAAISGRWERSALWTARARSAPRTATWTCSAQTSWRRAIVAVLREGAVVADAAVQLAQHRGERVQPRRREGHFARRARREVPAARRESRDGLPHRRRRPDDDLELGGGQLECEPRVAAEPVQHLDGPRDQVERARVEEHDLLLDSQGGWRCRVEDRAQAVLVCRSGGAEREARHDAHLHPPRRLSTPVGHLDARGRGAAAGAGPRTRVLDLCTGSGASRSRRRRRGPERSWPSTCRDGRC